MTAPTFGQLQRYRLSRGHPWFDAPHDLNLLIMRDEEVGNWRDWVCLAYTVEGGRRIVESFASSADASDREWIDPTHPDGCIFTVDQHVVSGFRPGMHGRGRWRRPALEQVAPFRYVRWHRRHRRKPTVAELQALEPEFGFVADRHTNLHDRVSDRDPDRPAPGDTTGCTLTRRRAAIARILHLCAVQKRHVGVDTLSPTFGRLRDLS